MAEDAPQSKFSVRGGYRLDGLRSETLGPGSDWNRCGGPFVEGISRTGVHPICVSGQDLKLKAKSGPPHFAD